MSTVPGRRIVRRSTTVAPAARWWRGLGRALGWMVGRAAPDPGWTIHPALRQPPPDPAPVVIDDDLADVLAEGTVIGDFRIEGLVARGGMSAVYRVRHTVLRSRYALKVLDRSLLLRHRRRHRWQLCARLRREGRIQSGLQHPNLLRVHDLIDLEGTPALVMDYVDGPTLEALIEGGDLTLDEIDDLARGMMAGLAVAHAAGVIHRDLKPANVLVSAVGGRWVPRIADFGIAKERADPTASVGIDDDLTRTGQILGTPGYMAPEQGRDAKGVDRGVDLFALGIVLFELVTGGRLADASDRATEEVVADRLVDLAQRDLPDRMVAAIEGALGRRFDEVEALAAVWRGEEAAPLVAAPPTDPRVWVTVGWAVGTVGTLVGLAVAPAVIGWLW